MKSKKNSTSFTSENQPEASKKIRGKSERTKILEALQRAGKTEDDFYDALIEKSSDLEDNFGFNEVIKRLSPIPKQVAPTISFEFDKTSKPHEQASYVLSAISSGVIPPDLGGAFIQSIKSMIDIEEYTTLKERITKIEESLGLASE